MSSTGQLPTAPVLDAAAPVPAAQAPSIPLSNAGAPAPTATHLPAATLEQVSALTNALIGEVMADNKGLQKQMKILTATRKAESIRCRLSTFPADSALYHEYSAMLDLFSAGLELQARLDQVDDLAELPDVREDMGKLLKLMKCRFATIQVAQSHSWYIARHYWMEIKRLALEPPNAEWVNHAYEDPAFRVVKKMKETYGTTKEDQQQPPPRAPPAAYRAPAPRGPPPFARQHPFQQGHGKRNNELSSLSSHSKFPRAT